MPDDDVCLEWDLSILYNGKMKLVRFENDCNKIQ